MAIKDWKKDKKVEGYGIDFWSKGRTNYVRLSDNGVEIVSGFQTVNDKRINKDFKSNSQSMNYAKSYMRSH